MERTVLLSPSLAHILPYDHFGRERSSHGVRCIYFMGKRLYRKKDLKEAIEQHYPG